MKLKLGTRGSDLALVQSRWVAQELAAIGIETEIVIISTAGDRSSAPSFGAIGPQGVFVREIEQALIDRRVDVAVHSLKDLPTQSPAELSIGAVPARRDAADWLIFRGDGDANTDDGQLLPLAHGAHVGTAAARRQAWLRHFRADLQIGSLRGNVPTRIRRLADGDFDAIVLAGAGLDRLTEASNVLDASLAGLKRQRLDPLRFVPAPAQGALAIQCREDASELRDALTAIDDPPTRLAVDLERAVLALAEAGCDAAFGAYAHSQADGCELRVMAERDGKMLSVAVSGVASSELAALAWEQLGKSNERS